jgi:DNA-binding transcriptional ArsR family regulator
VAARRPLTPELLTLVAGRFKALAEPARLHILNALRNGDASVTEIIDRTGLGQANVSKHLQMLHALGFVSRRRDGLHTVYELSDPEVFRLCDIMCGRIEAEHTARNKVLGGR